MQYLWYVFVIITFIGLSIDVVVLNRRKEAPSLTASSLITLGWISVTIFFSGMLYVTLGHDSALKFITGYVLEFSLSIDNLFVFMSIFMCFRLPPKAQQIALTFGLYGAIILRFVFIFAGLALISKFHWLLYVFGILLILSGGGMLLPHDNKDRLNKCSERIKKFLKIENGNTSRDFFARRGNRWYITPLLACIIAIECADIVFALDSVPAILAITREPIIVFSSNIFAIIGLRSLYVFLIHMANKFHLLKYGIAANLIFAGLKMLLEPWYDIPVIVSVVAIISIIFISMIASQVFKKISV